MSDLTGSPEVKLMSMLPGLSYWREGLEVSKAKTPVSFPVWADSPWDLGNYQESFRFPLIEMLARGRPGVPIEEEIANELIVLAASEDQRGRKRRKVRLGDVFSVNDQWWLYCHEYDAKDAETRGIKTIVLPRWSGTAIANIKGPNVNTQT